MKGCSVLSFVLGLGSVVERWTAPGSWAGLSWAGLWGVGVACDGWGCHGRGFGGCGCRGRGCDGLGGAVMGWRHSVGGLDFDLVSVIKNTPEAGRL